MKLVPINCIITRYYCTLLMDLITSEKLNLLPSSFPYIIYFECVHVVVEYLNIRENKKKKEFWSVTKEQIFNIFPHMLLLFNMVIFFYSAYLHSWN